MNYVSVVSGRGGGGSVVENIKNIILGYFV